MKCTSLHNDNAKPNPSSSYMPGLICLSWRPKNLTKTNCWEIICKNSASLCKTRFVPWMWLLVLSICPSFVNCQEQSRLNFWVLPVQFVTSVGMLKVVTCLVDLELNERNRKEHLLTVACVNSDLCPSLCAKLSEEKKHSSFSANQKNVKLGSVAMGTRMIPQFLMNASGEVYQKLVLTGDHETFTFIKVQKSTAVLLARREDIFSFATMSVASDSGFSSI